MKGFKDTTRTQYTKGGPSGGPKGAAKTSSIMCAFKRGTLHGGQEPATSNHKG